ncbi:MAG: hypothetical protein JOZ14_03620 [Acidobacteria bacterium]|nr:hypothetical protein [Acidobacteriota bacterium]
MQFIWYSVIFTAIAWLIITATSRKRLIAVILSGAMVLMLVGAPRPAQSQVPTGILSAIQSVLAVINGLIKTAVTAIYAARNVLSDLQQIVAFPQAVINQARAQVRYMVSRYRTVMATIIHLDLKSATLPAAQALEAVIRDHQVNNFPVLTSTFGSTFGLVPVATEASPADRAMSDMDDALALDSLKLLKAGDQAADIEIQSADSIENTAGQAAPGSAPLLTAASIVSAINSQALTQKMLAAELRQEAARLAHRNTLCKENVNHTAQLRGILVNLLQHQ